MILWIADVDGVFTNDRAKPNQEAITLSAKIGHREPFGYVTGRGAKWLYDHLLPTLTAAYKKEAPRLGIACAEYGGIILRWQDGQWHKEHNPHFPALDDLRAEVRARIAKIPGVFFDEGKEVMISVEARHELRATDHDLVEKGLETAEQLLQEQAASRPELEYQRTTYACDLVPKRMNKEHGASEILAHITGTPEHAHLIGDARSDLLLAHPFRDKNIPYTVHFVGKETALSDELREKYVIEVSSRRYDEGTLEVLKRFA